ncbi:M15 family metallopeptidase [Stenotrophomonas sp. SMYL8]|uniref:M15 family metallopeptidase n=1 Tax=Stenotrophomonas sp. SMYL8 TaxID=3076041 RepID=UPI002E79F470|nr:M15 family metallopeptidase [Stenotrophomonas sp. SMYL8]
MQLRFTIAAALACLALAGCSTVEPKPKPFSAWAYQPPKSHGAIHRFFHPKSGRVWKGVSPALREKVEAVQAQLAVEGFDVRPLEGYRSPERQAALLASASGVTTVGAYSSCHNFGLALDAAVFVNGQPSWDLGDPHVMAGYFRFGELSEMVGLNWGGRWTSPKDYPHVELRAECVQAKWAHRNGKPRRPFAPVIGKPAPYALALALTPQWCPAGMATECLLWSNENRYAWSLAIPERVYSATFPNSLRKIA